MLVLVFVVMLVMVVMLVLVFVVMLVMVVMLVLFLVIMVMMVVAAARRIVALLVIVMVVMVVMVVRLLLELRKLNGDGAALIHCVHQLLARQLVPRRRDNDRVLVVLTDHVHALVELLLAHAAGTAEDDGVGGLDLVIIELAEVLHIHFALCRVGHRHKIAELHIVARHLAHRADDIRQLADARRLDQDALGVVLVDHLFERASEITHQRAADAAGVHLGDLNSGLLQKASVNADLAEFVLDQNELLAVIGFLDHLFDERGLARAEETGINVNFRHEKTPSM